jgi:hypothetical protein
MDFKKLLEDKTNRDWVTDIDQVNENAKKYEVNEFTTIAFNFTRAHNGLKRTMGHMLMGPTGKGKSTVTRSIIIQAARQHRVLIYSTEESFEDTNYNYGQMGFTDIHAKNLFFMHEDDCVDPIAEIYKSAIENSVDFIFFDNVTTSRFYDPVQPLEKSDFFRGLKKIGKDLNTVMFYVAHTDANTRSGQQKLIDNNDVRGYKLISNMCEYTYSVEMYEVTLDRIVYEGKGFTKPKNIKVDEKIAFLRILKTRYGVENTIFKLSYDSKSRSYLSDTAVPFDDFNTAFKSQNRLGMK